jgi:hypothetical protein
VNSPPISSGPTDVKKLGIFSQQSTTRVRLMDRPQTLSISEEPRAKILCMDRHNLSLHLAARHPEQLQAQPPVITLSHDKALVPI